MKNTLILATVGGFLDKFEKGNVRILRSMGYTVHYAANMREKHYLFEEEAVRKLGGTFIILILQDPHIC